MEEDEDILCFCMWLTRDEVLAALPTARDLKHLREQTGVCTVCFGCEAELAELVADNGHLFGTGL
jgi:bacterioferritin-associated ferredoxin